MLVEQLPDIRHVKPRSEVEWTSSAVHIGTRYALCTCVEYRILDWSSWAPVTCKKWSWRRKPNLSFWVANITIRVFLISINLLRIISPFSSCNQDCVTSKTNLLTRSIHLAPDITQFLDSTQTVFLYPALVTTRIYQDGIWTSYICDF